METQNTTLVILIGLSLRLIVPIVLTALVVYSLRKLDARWQAEAREEKKVVADEEMPCLKGLSADQMKSIMPLSDQACWQARRLHSGYLNDACLECEIFLNAPKPAARTHAHI